MPRLRAPGLRTAVLVGLATLALVPAAGRAADDRLLPARPAVLVDGTGRVLGLAYPSTSGPVTAAQVWLRIGGRDLLLTATPDALGLGPELDVGYVAFAEPDCAGSAWFVPAFGVPLVFTPVALGPGNTLFAPDGPLDFVGTNSAWHPSAPTPCQPEPGGFVQLQRALGILDLGTFSPPFTVR